MLRPWTFALIGAGALVLGPPLSIVRADAAPNAQPGVEVQARELYVKFGKPGGITESARSDPRFNRLGHLEVQPVEPLQAITVDAGTSDRLHGLEDVGDGLRGHPDGGEERRVVGEHAVYCSSAVCSWSIADLF